MTDHTGDLLQRLKTWCEAYPPEIFPPPAGSYRQRDGDYDTEEKRGIITKASAAMGRHMIERAIKPAIEEIERLEAALRKREDRE